MTGLPLIAPDDDTTRQRLIEAHACTQHAPGNRQCHTDHGCTCPDCLNASYLHSKRNRLRAARGEGNQPPHGVRRRLQALMRRGWSLAELGRRLGRSKSSMTALLTGVTYVQWATHAAVAALYDELWDQEPDRSTRDARRAATRAQRHAEREGWPPAAALAARPQPTEPGGARAMPHATEYAPQSAIISRYLYERQLQVAGTYKTTSGGNRVRAWTPPRSIHRKMQAFIFERDQGICQICGEPAKFWELDHIKPYRAGGIYIEWNLRLACVYCNASKGAKEPA